LSKIIIRNAKIINEGNTFDTDILIENERIEKISPSISVDNSVCAIDAAGRFLIPGMIDDQVHCREPGLTHKADLVTESSAAVAGGITSFMEMPNVEPKTINKLALDDKYKRAKGRCRTNYGFYLGANNTNIEAIKSLSLNDACGIKAFMGASTGNMLIDDPGALELLFEHAPIMVVTHCEDSPTIWKNEAQAREKFGEDVPMSQHPIIRSDLACYKSSNTAINLAKKHDALLHVLHLTTAKEMQLFSNKHRSEKRITAEVCVHHLWFDEDDYALHGTNIKCNPAIKSSKDRMALIEALRSGKIDVIATDHAPHTSEEKSSSYFNAPAGLPLVQHALPALFDLVAKQELSAELVVDRACHAPADLFGVENRGYIREGYFADLVLLDTNKENHVNKENILYKCGWSPFEGHSFKTTIDTTIVNGTIVYEKGALTGAIVGRRMTYNRAR
jgi:dihydroorotase|tara:strand:- start:6791 stop:8131 length:1341 start_codon:yes stop_codon:yes gene_type:complete